MLPTAWTIHNGPCPGTLPPMPELHLNYMCLAPRKHPDQTHPWMAAGKKLTQTLRKYMKQFIAFFFELYLFTSPSFFYIRSLDSSLGKILLCDKSPPPSRAASFPKRVSLPCSNNSPPDELACCLARSMSLVTMVVIISQYIHTPKNHLKVTQCYCQ